MLDLMQIDKEGESNEVIRRHIERFENIMKHEWNQIVRSMIYHSGNSAKAMQNQENVVRYIWNVLQKRLKEMKEKYNE